MAELGQETVEFSTLVSRAAEESFLSLKELVEKSKSSTSTANGEMSDSEKKINLLKFIVKTQQRMLRLNVLAKWCQQVPLIQYCQQLGSTLSSHDTCFTQTADSLFFMHEGLQQARAPIYDVPSAVEVLLTGTYERLPKCVEDVGALGILTNDQKKPALRKLDTLVRSKLLELSLPKEFSEVKVSDGTAVLRVDGEFKVLITLGYRGHLTLWRILHMELLVGEKSGPVKMEELRQHALGDDIERRMAAADNPFSTLYSVLHELCVSLVMDTVIRQVQALRQGRWKDAIRFELISEGGSSAPAQTNQEGESESINIRTPGLKIMYWLNSDKSSGTSDAGSCPFIKIESGSDLQIKCLHSTFVIDPSTGKEAEFSLDQSCIDVEKLLLRAICCNRYTRLFEIQKELSKNGQIFRTASDVILQSKSDELEVVSKKKDDSGITKEYEGQEVLRVRAYGSSFFTLGINIRNGQFLLQSSRNILTPSALVECEDALNQGSISAVEVFSSLRSKSILHLFASIGRFLGLKVYEHGFATVKIPKNILNGSTSILMGFPDCGSSYFLLLQLDKEFKPLIRLLETEPDWSEKSDSPGDSNNIIRIKKIDIDQMQVLEDELNLSLLDWEKVYSLFPRSGGTHQASEHGHYEFGLRSCTQMTGCTASSFSSIVDDVFELEKGSSESSRSVQDPISSFSSPPASHLGSLPTNHRGIKIGTSSPMWDASRQIPQTNDVSKVPNASPQYNNALYSLGNLKGSVQSGSVSMLPSGPGRGAVRKLSASKSEQDLVSVRSPQLADVSPHSVFDEDQLRLVCASSKDIAARTSCLLSPPHPPGLRGPLLSSKSTGPICSPGGSFDGATRTGVSSSWIGSPTSQGADLAAYNVTSSDGAYGNEKKARKRSISDVLNMIPSLLDVETSGRPRKRKKISELTIVHQPMMQLLKPTAFAHKSEGYSYGSLITEANIGNAPSSFYVSVLLHVVKHCSLCIKHARLTSQMDALHIEYVEEIGLRTPSSNIWFRLPFVSGDSWPHICLRLGRPGSLYWDVKINDQHFRDLWDLQKGSSNTPWGSGVRIANTSDVDSHIRFDPDGVVLSYHSVEAESIGNLVADIRRLSDARLFALGMRKLLGVRMDEKVEENNVNTDSKALTVGKISAQGADKLSEQMRRAFRIEAVGLMSLWFSFGSGVLARFVVEWESGKEGCTMHVTPDQLWPHTKFLEDFINGAEVASLLDCIRLTAGPLHALAAATRPARASPVSGISGVSAAISSIAKQTGSYIAPQGLLQNSSTASTGQTTSGPVGNAIASTATGPLGGSSFHGASVLAAAGRGGPGIVPSSLLPIDVSVVLRGPYWIRIIYRKFFAVDMRCFAGDQVWLQPATPPKGGPSVGGSLPCPQFRPFIMEHVAQELNGLEPNFSSPQPAVGNANPNLSSQSPVINGNRANPPSSTGVSRPGQVSGVNRVVNAVPGASNVAAVNSGLPLRRSSATNVPPHMKGELNTAIIGLGDDGGYGGGWVPLVALKKVLRGILKYLGVLWLFAQLPDLLKEILGSILKDNEGALLNLDQEQPALRFFVGGYVFAVSVHRVQLLLQILSVKRFHQQQQQQQQQPHQSSASAQEELTQPEISEICDYFSRRVASEPYDASRVASFITLLTLPISVLREFLKLIAWKKGMAQAQAGDSASPQKPRIELCLENHVGCTDNKLQSSSSASKSNIHYDRPHNSVDFGLTVVLDSTNIPHINAAGGAAWLPYCASVRLRYSFGENPSPSVTFLGMEGSHGGQACWTRAEEWEKCKQRVARMVEMSCSSADVNQGRLRVVADNIQRALQLCLQGLRDGAGVTANSGGT